MQNNTDVIAHGAKIKTLKSYCIGLFLSIIFTCVAFGLVYFRLLDHTELLISITVLAIAQLLAQVIYFLRLSMSPEGRWNTMPFIFTLLLVGVLVGGSLWIMYNLDMNMMPS